MTARVASIADERLRPMLMSMPDNVSDRSCLQGLDVDRCYGLARPVWLSQLLEGSEIGRVADDAPRKFGQLEQPVTAEASQCNHRPTS